jgi:signal transduction histidine kinase
MKWNARPKVVTFFLLSLWVIVTLLIFLDLERRSSAESSRLAKALATRFKVSWISSPDNETNRHLFRTMRREYFDELAAGPQLFKQVFLTWVHPGTGREVFLYPLSWVGRDPRDIPTAGLIKEPLIDDFRLPLEASGYLYFQIDPWQKQATPIIFLLAAVNVLFLLLLLLFWLSRLSSRYEQTQFELERKKQELIQLEQLALAGKLTAGLLHDLKKPVIHIREECREGNTPEEALRDIHEQSELFLAMLRESGLEDFARRRSLTPEYCDIIDLAERSLRLVEYERNEVQVSLRAESDVPFVWARPTRLLQVFSNLILNAYQAMRGRGNLSITISAEGPPGTRTAVVVIADTGPGIPPGRREHVFEPFFTTGKDGSGLGLYIARTILSDLGGEIRLEDSPGSGAVFRVILPEGRKQL